MDDQSFNLENVHQGDKIKVITEVFSWKQYDILLVYMSSAFLMEWNERL